jgi:hypothetical protein
MKILVLICGLFFGAFAHAASGTILITCKGNIGSSSVYRLLTFGGSHPTLQDFAFSGNTVYSIQLGSFEGFIDILMVQTVKDEKGNIISSGYVRTHGGTALDLVDSAKHINLTCDMSEAPVP